MDFRNKIFCCKSDFTFFTYIILSTILTFYIRSSDLNHHTAQSLCPFASLCLFPLLSHPQPLETTFYSVFLWVRLFCFFKVPHVSDTMPYLSFSVWLISLSIIFSGSIHVVIIGRIFFFLKAEDYFMYTPHLFIRWQTLRLFPYLGYCE